MPNYAFSVPVTDEGGRGSNITGYIVAASTAAVDTRIAALAGLADALMEGVIAPTYNLTEIRTHGNGSIKTSANVGSDRRKKGKFTFGSSNGFNKLLTLPTFDDIAFGSPDGAINLSLQAVIDFRDEILTGGYSTNRYEDLISLIKAVEDFG